ncbi:uncharacterized protein [Littorina saxatilis]|uniref:uncharacterized protein n=1 Tax=Littorina saxatilis TaxID=31220 RepID=UPI0038B54F98
MNSQNLPNRHAILFKVCYLTCQKNVFSTLWRALFLTTFKLLPSFCTKSFFIIRYLCSSLDPNTCGDEPTTITDPSTAASAAANTPETTSHVQQTTMDTTKEPTIIKGPPTAESTNTTDELTPTYIWPLNNVTVGVGVLSGILPVLPLEATSCFRADDSDTSLARPHLKFDGSLPSYLGVPVNDSVFAGDFTIVLFVKAEQPAEGVLLDYTSSDPSAQGLSRIQIAFDNDSSLEVSLWSATDGGPSLCDHLVISNPFNDSTDWKKLVVKRKLSTEKLEVRVDGAALATARYNCSGGEGRGSLGRMNIGGRRDVGRGRAGAGFRGSLKCLRILESVFNIPWHYGTCEQFTDDVPQNAQDCLLEKNMREKGFCLVAKGTQPDASAHPPIRSVETLSVVACAEMCLRTVNCKSFVITAGQTSRKGCDMYDYVTHINTVNSAGKKYYELKN